jgi:hypothetical protein
MSGTAKPQKRDAGATAFRRRATRLGFKASKAAGGDDVWRLYLAGSEQQGAAIVGTMQRCERFLRDQAAALGGAVVE